MSSVSVQLAVVAGEGNVTATLTFMNSSAEDVFLEKVNACINGTIRNNVFQVVSDIDRVPYIGIFAKRAMPGPDGFFRLAAGACHKVRVHLNDAYGFFPGWHAYRIHYVAKHPYIHRPDETWELKSDECAFSFAK